MPRVPSYDEFQATPQSFQPTRVDSNVPQQTMSIAGEQLQSLGRGLQQFGNAASQVAIDVQKDINEANTRAADNAFTNDANRVMARFMSMTGKDAVDNQEAVQKALQDLAMQSADGLQNDMQRRMYHDVASRRLAQVNGQVVLHTVTQAKQWNIAETKARINNNSDDASNNFMQWKDTYADMRVDPSTVDRSSWDKRSDGTAKGMGFLGPLKNANGGVSTELSIGVKIDGKEMEIPTLVPTLTRKEVQTVTSLKDGEKLPESIVEKAVAHAKQRIADGKSVFAEDDEGPQQQSNRYTQAKATMIADTNALVQLEWGAGPDSEIAKAARLERLTGMHANTIAKMIVAGQARTASDYFESAMNTGEIDPSKAKPLQEMVRTANVSDESLRLSRQLTGGFDSKIKQLEAMHEKGQITAEVFRETRAEVEHKWTVQKAQEAEYEKRIKGSATDWAINNPNKSIQDFKRENPVQYNYMMDHGQLDDLDRVIKSGGKVETDRVVWANLMTNIDEIKGKTPIQLQNEYGMKVSASDMDKLFSMHSALNGSKDEQHLSIFSNAEMVSDSAKRLKILPRTGKPSDDQSDRFDAFQMAVDARVASYEATELGGKRKASQQELKKILQQVEMDTVYRPQWGRDKEVPTLSLTADEQKNAYVTVMEQDKQTSKSVAVDVPIAAVPRGQRKLIMDGLRAAGEPITEKNIVQWWVRKGRMQDPTSTK